MATKSALQKYTGVYITESTKKKWRERSDRCYWVNFKRDGKLYWERCGWASEGWTAEAAQRRRYEILDQDRVGDYKPKRERKKDQLTFSQLMTNHYLPWSEQNLRRPSDNTYRYEKWIRPVIGEKTLGQVSALDLERIKKNMRDTGRSDATTRHVLGIVRQAFNAATKWRLWEGANPAKLVKFPRSDNRRQRFLNPEEAEGLLTELRSRSPQVAQMATLSLYGGLRFGELASLEWGNIDRASGIIHIRDTKSGDSRVIYITPPIEEILDELRPGDPTSLVFHTPKGEPIKEVSRIFNQVVKALGFNNGVEDRRQRICFHSLRHSYASWAVMSGIPLFVVSRALGHKTTQMTERYSHLSPSSQRSCFDAVVSYADMNRAAEESEVV